MNLFLKQIGRKKTSSVSVNSNNGHQLKRILTVSDLVYFGVAGVIGAGLFSSIGRASFVGGPGVSLLFVLIGIVCILIALCYAEFASAIPLTGSSYSYAYYVFGELVAWIIGWVLIIEYTISNIIISISWSAYFVNILHALKINFPPWLGIDFISAHQEYKMALKNNLDTSLLVWTQAPEILGIKIILNIPAFIIVILITVIAYIGIKESKNFSKLMVIIKLATLFIFVVVGFFLIDFNNYIPFMPNGFGGVLHGVSAVFFAYIGFEAVSTCAEETIDPQRNLPKAMMLTILICSGVYIIVAIVLTGMTHYSLLNVSDPLAFVFEQKNMIIFSYVISSLSLIAASSTLIMYQVSQPRLWMNMSRDGLLPRVFGNLHPKFLTPSFSTILTGLIIALVALVVEPKFMTDLTSIGTLFAFMLVSFGVLLLPKNLASKGFKVPYINGRYILPFLYLVFVLLSKQKISDIITQPNMIFKKSATVLFCIYLILSLLIIIYSMVKKFSLIPILATLLSLYLMIEIPVNSWFVFFIWMAIGFVIYFLYGYKNSVLRKLK